MKNNLKISILVLFAIVVITVFSLKPVVNSINYGLDLKGGFEVLYEVSPLNEDEELTNDMLTSTYKSITNRIDTLGVSEPEISIEGDKIRVKLPGVTDEEEARKRLSTPAVLTFRNSSDELLMVSDVLDSPGASLDYNQAGKPVVALKVKDNDTFYRVTDSVSNSNDQLIVIWLDFDESEHSFENMKEECGTSNAACISSATVRDAFSSNVVIEGNFTKEEAQELVDLINSGSLPTKLTEVSTKTVDASFGSDTLRIAAIASVITLIVITLIMTCFYRLSGFISSICLVFYSVIVLAMFNAIDGVLTLTGIAALILGIGMAVDSSIITLEKIKDEINNGKKLDKAFSDANKRSLVSLIDANMTTLIVAVILFMFGESSVKGFGSMLILTIIVVVILIIYLEQVERQREIDKTAIKTACNEYIKMVDSLIILPEDLQGYSQNLTQEDENKLKENINNELKKVMIDNQDAIDIQSQFIYETLKQANENKITTKCNKTIEKITKYEFDGDQVIVNFSSNLNTTYKQMNLETNIEEEKENIQSIYGEEITLQKIDGLWKIVYSYLNYYQESSDMFLY